MPFIIDGNNLLCSVQDMPAESDSITDRKLCYLLDRYFRVVCEKAVMVFDGAGPPQKATFDNIANVEVVFAGPNNDADSVIEDKISASSAPDALIIVSSDRRLRAAARAAKATALTSPDFWKAVRQTMHKARAVSQEPAAKRTGITSSETEQWLKFFGIEQ
jgi:predicted RNA-binding protein with PIN domain